MATDRLINSTQGDDIIAALLRIAAKIGVEGGVYTAGDGINISDDEISVDTTYVSTVQALNAHKNAVVLDHPNNSVTWEKLASAVQERINTGGGATIETVTDLDAFYTAGSRSVSTRLGTYDSGGFVISTSYHYLLVQLIVDAKSGGAVRCRSGEADADSGVTWEPWTQIYTRHNELSVEMNDGSDAVKYTFDMDGSCVVSIGYLDEEDTIQWTSNFPLGADIVGKLPTLTTTAKTNAVAAINEVNAGLGALSAAVGTANAALERLLTTGV